MERVCMLHRFLGGSKGMAASIDQALDNAAFCIWNVPKPWSLGLQPVMLPEDEELLGGRA